MRIRELLKKNRDEILHIAERHGATNVRIFGSVARGQGDSESDLDVLVDFEKGRSLMDHAALVIDLEDLLGCRVDVATERGLKERIREQISRDSVPLRGMTAHACSISWMRQRNGPFAPAR